MYLKANKQNDKKTKCNTYCINVHRGLNVIRLNIKFSEVRYAIWFLFLSYSVISLTKRSHLESCTRLFALSALLKSCCKFGIYRLAVNTKFTT